MKLKKAVLGIVLVLFAHLGVDVVFAQTAARPITAKDVAHKETYPVVKLLSRIPESDSFSKQMAKIYVSAERLARALSEGDVSGLEQERLGATRLRWTMGPHTPQQN